MAPAVAAVLLAAGLSRRYGERNKLLEPLDGKPLVAHAAASLIAGGARPVIVVTGHEAARVEAALSDQAVRFVHNLAYAQGMGTSVAAGIAALPPGTAGALIAQADMPAMTAALIGALIGRFGEASGARIVRPRGPDGVAGTPVVWPRAFFGEFASLDGDSGGRDILARHAAEVAYVDLTDDAALTDVDTPADLARLKP